MRSASHVVVIARMLSPRYLTSYLQATFQKLTSESRHRDVGLFQSSVYLCCVRCNSKDLIEYEYVKRRNLLFNIFLFHRWHEWLIIDFYLPNPFAQNGRRFFVKTFLRWLMLYEFHKNNSATVATKNICSVYGDPPYSSDLPFV